MSLGINHAQLGEAVLACWNATGPDQRRTGGEIPFVWSPPGAGKSDSIKKAARQYLASRGIELLRDAALSLFRRDDGSTYADDQENGGDEFLASITPGTKRSHLKGGLIVLRCSVLEPPDLSGLLYPDLENGVTRLLPPEYLPTEGTWVVFFDEASQTSKASQRGLMGVMDRDSIRAVSREARFVCAGNRIEDRAGAESVISPILSRVIHYDLGTRDPKSGEWTFDSKAWASWALQAGLRSEIPAFLLKFPEHLYKFDPAARSCPTLRGWEKVANLLETTPPSLRLATFSGTVGEAAAGSLVQYLAISDRMPDLDFILKDPAKAPVPGEIDVMYAVVCGIVSRVVHEAKLVEAAFQYANRLPDDYSAFLGRELYGAAAGTGALSTRCKAYGDWLVKHERALATAVRGR